MLKRIKFAAGLAGLLVSASFGQSILYSTIYPEATPNPDYWIANGASLRQVADDGAFDTPGPKSISRVSFSFATVVNDPTFDMLLLFYDDAAPADFAEVLNTPNVGLNALNNPALIEGFDIGIAPDQPGDFLAGRLYIFTLTLSTPIVFPSQDFIYEYVFLQPNSTALVPQNTVMAVFSNYDGPGLNFDFFAWDANGDGQYTDNATTSETYAFNPPDRSQILLELFGTEGGSTPIPGDTDSSGCVDDADLTNIILDFGAAGGSSTGFPGTDINGDGVVDDADLTDLISNFGTGC